MRRFGVLLSAAVAVMVGSTGASAATPAAHRLGTVPGGVSGGMALVNRTLYVSGGVERDDGVPTTRLSRVSAGRTVLAQRDFVGIASAPAVGDGHLWVTTSSGARGVVQAESGFLFRFDPLTLRRTGRVEVGQNASQPVVGAGWVFVAVGDDILRVDADWLRITARHTFRTGNAPDRVTRLAFADGWLWVLDDPNGEPGATRVLRIDPGTMTQSVETTVPGHDFAFAVGSSRVWVAYTPATGGTWVREIQVSTGRVKVDRRLSLLPYALYDVSSDAANNLWYLTAAGSIGKVSPDGSRTTSSVDLRPLHPTQLVASRSRVAVATDHGIEELAPS